MKILESYKKIAKSMLTEHSWDRKFGEPLPTLKDVTEKHQIEEKETYERMFGPLIVEGNKDYYFHSKKTKNVAVMVRDAGSEFVVMPKAKEALKMKANFKKLGVDAHGTQMFTKKSGQLVLKRLRKDKDFYEDNS